MFVVVLVVVVLVAVLAWVVVLPALVGSPDLVTVLFVIVSEVALYLVVFDLVFLILIFFLSGVLSFASNYLV